MTEVATKTAEQVLTKGMENGYGYGIIGVVLILLIVFIGYIYYKLDETNKKYADTISSRLPELEKQVTAAITAMQKENTSALNQLRQDATAAFTKMSETMGDKHQNTKDDIEEALKSAIKTLTDAIIALSTSTGNLSASSQISNNNINEIKVKIDNLMVAITKVETLVRTCSRTKGIDND